MTSTSSRNWIIPPISHRIYNYTRVCLCEQNFTRAWSGVRSMQLFRKRGRVAWSWLPGVWKLMRLISTGSLGWWGVISALFSKHLIRGSESLRLLEGENRRRQERSRWVKRRGNQVPTTIARSWNLRCLIGQAMLDFRQINTCDLFWMNNHWTSSSRGKWYIQTKNCAEHQKIKSFQYNWSSI